MKEKFPIAGILKLLEQERDCVFLETARPDAENSLSYIFLRPQKVISTFEIDRVKHCFGELEQALKQGRYVAGFVSYEAGEAFEESLKHRQAYEFPLLWFGVYEQALIYNHRQESFKLTSAPATAAFMKRIIAGKNYKQKNYSLKNIRPNISQSSYTKAIAKIKHLIAGGFTYQVNYTFKLKFSFSGSPFAFYLNLRNNQRVGYSALIKTNRFYILSFSPELFFRKSANTICARPMKGTAGRGRDLTEDSKIAQELENCPKNRSENLMIVDLLRNDLGRISNTGTVKVPRLFNVERYETLFQMTSDIEGQLRLELSAFDIFRYIFPSGSVTGAPKIKTMEIIRQLEKEPRNVYTGSIGFFSPEKRGVFNVAIRTILIDGQKNSGEMGVGSGIVYDSSAQKEYAECRLKTDFLIKNSDGFQLIETMLWQSNKGYLFLRLHLRRLEDSANYFNFLYKKEDALKALRRLQKSFLRNTYKVRLLLFKDGSIKLEPSLFEPQNSKEPKVYFAQKRTFSLDPFLYHKTTSRRIYDQEYKRCQRLGYHDAIFTNEKGQITEGAISNVFIRKNGQFYTPPINCGLLAGIYRRYLLNSRKKTIREKILFKEDVAGADEIYLGNSVRGLVRVHLEGQGN